MSAAMIRRRTAVANHYEELEKPDGKPPPSRLCFLISLSALFWILILYIHFFVLANSTPHGSAPGKLPSIGTTTSHFHMNANRKFPKETPLNPPASETPVQQLSPPPVVEKKIVVAEVTQPEPPPAVEESMEVEARQVEPPPAIEKVEAAVELRPNPLPQNPKHAEKEVMRSKSFPFSRALATANDKSDRCGGRYIYVHDLPPRFNEDMLRDCTKLSLWTNMCKFMINDGLGPPLDNSEGVFSETGWYATNQFAVDVIFGNRMKQYDCLTKDSSLAAAVFVPFYAGFDVARYLWGYNITTRDSASLDLVDWLMKRPEWNVMGGRDHFLVAGRITWDFRRLSDEETDWGNKLLFLPAAKNMSMLVVESSPWNANDYGIPYPTYFHPAKDADVFTWQERMRRLERKWLFSFAGAPRPNDPKSIRGQIMEQCKKSEVCKLLECDFGESKCHSPSSIMNMFQGSLFCLQPQGDSYTRRSAFDSMLAGCIPVFFHPGSAYVQYTWHLPRFFAKYSVFISEDDVRKHNVSIEKRLKMIPRNVVRQMREEVISLIPRLVYADPRSKLETLKDAFDVAVDAVINKVTKLRQDIIAGREDKEFIEENSWKYALLDNGVGVVGPHEWDPFFSKPKDGSDSGSSSAEAAKNSWKSEQREHM